MLSRSHLRALPLNDMELALASFGEMEKEGETEKAVDCSLRGHVVSK